jgi:hypothetical protein
VSFVLLASPARKTGGGRPIARDLAFDLLGPEIAFVPAAPVALVLFALSRR